MNDKIIIKRLVKLLNEHIGPKFVGVCSCKKKIVRDSCGVGTIELKKSERKCLDCRTRELLEEIE